MYSAMPLSRGRFSPKSSQYTPHSSPVRTRYGVSVVILKSDSMSATVIALLYVISWVITPHYNGTWLYFGIVISASIVNVNTIYQIRAVFAWLVTVDMKPLNDVLFFARGTWWKIMFLIMSRSSIMEPLDFKMFYPLILMELCCFVARFLPWYPSGKPVVYVEIIQVSFRKAQPNQISVMSHKVSYTKCMPLCNNGKSMVQYGERNQMCCEWLMRCKFK